jgi:hypothetical protein
MPRSAVRLIVLLAALSGIAHAGPGASYMIGTWFGQGQPEDKESMYIDRMRADGSWRGEYRTCFKGKPIDDQIQAGHWSLAGDMLSLKVESVNGAKAPRTDYYKMLSHSVHAQKYVSLGWNFPYTPQRVADDFQMPSCELTG